MKSVYDILRYFIIFILGFFAISAIFLVSINPESYFFGERIFDENALLHSFTLAGIAIFSIFLLFTKDRIGKFLALGFFVYMLVEDMAFAFATTVSLYPPFLILVGLIPSIALSFIKKK